MTLMRFIICLSVFIVVLIPQLSFGIEGSDSMNKGITAYDKGDYKTAIKYFYVHTMENPKDIEGQLYLGRAKLLNGNPEGAINNFIEATKMNAKDSRPLSGISLCKLVKYDMALDKAPEASGNTKKSITDVYGRFINVINNKNWNDLSIYSAPHELLMAAGMYARTPGDLKTSLNTYLLIISSPVMKTYFKQLAIEKIYIKGAVARIHLSDAEKKIHEFAYLSQINGKWRVVLFPRTMSTGGSDEK